MMDFLLGLFIGYAIGIIIVYLIWKDLGVNMTNERIKRMFLASIILQELEEDEQDALMCASIEMLAGNRKMSPFDLMKQYIEAIIEVNFNEDKRK